MSIFVAVDQIDKVFELTGGGQYIALKGIDLQIKKGEFVSLNWSLWLRKIHPFKHDCWFRFTHRRYSHFRRTKN